MRNDLPTPNIAVTLEMGEAKIVNSKTRSQISQSLRDSGKFVLEGQAMGATTLSYEQRSQVFANEVLNGPGISCGVPQAEVLLRIPDPVIDVAAEFTPGTCRYALVLEHEFLHVEAARAHLSKVAGTLERAFQERYGSQPLIFAESQQAIVAKLQQDSAEWLVPLVSAELGRSQLAQAAIDNPAEYHRLTVACPSEPLVETEHL